MAEGRPDAPGAAAARAMVARAAIEGPELATVDGRPVAAAPGGDGDPPVLGALAEALYASCYAQLTWPPAGAPGDEEDLAPELAAANAAQDVWEAGWRFVRWHEGRALARRGAVLRGWWPGQWIRDDGAPVPVEKDVPMRVLHPAASRSPVTPGFWLCHGSGGPDPDAGRVRVYFNVGRVAAPALVERLTRRLRRLEVPFFLKVADRPSRTLRRDSAVLYTEARHFRVVAPVAVEAAERLPEPLGAEPPPFTKPLVRGVGMAEDDRGATSFGQRRCELVAEGLWRAHGRGAGDEDARVDAVGEAFAAAGLDFARPWLAARDHPDRYELHAG